MYKNEVIEFLLDNSLSEVEVVKDKKNILVLTFFYDFDKDEIEAAESYANDEGDYEEKSTEWYGELFLPYLKDIAVDNVSDILEDLSEEFSCSHDMKYDEMDASTYTYMKFYVAVAAEDSDEELDVEEFI